MLKWAGCFLTTPKHLPMLLCRRAGSATTIWGWVFVLAYLDSELMEVSMHRLVLVCVLCGCLVPLSAWADDKTSCEAIVDCGLESDAATCLAVLRETPGLAGVLAACASSSTDCDQLGACLATAFDGDDGGLSPTEDHAAVTGGSAYDMTIRSRTASLEATGALQPGELRMVDGECGVFFTQSPSEAIFYLCDGSVVVGPLTSEAEVSEFFARLSEASQSGHDLRMEILGNLPDGDFRPKTKVREVDETGKTLHEYNE